MYKHYPNTLPSEAPQGGYTADEVRRGFVALHTDYTCPFCGRVQSVPQMGGYGGDCVQCGKPSRPN
jgi:transcription elongation factor Elf1